MKMDRDINPDGMGKYALIKWRQFRELEGARLMAAKEALETLQRLGVLDEGIKGTEAEFFVMRLKDVYSTAALEAYANSALISGDDEYAAAVHEMVGRSGVHSEFCQQPD